MKFKILLENMGLSDKEAKVYLVLLELNDATSSEIAKRANVKRPTTYVILNQLKERGIVSYVKKNNVQYFRGLHPSLLLEDQYNRYMKLKAVLPDLVGLHEKYAVQPQITLYEGREGLMSILEDTLTTSTELLCWADVQLASKSTLEDYYPIYSQKKVKRKLPLRGIFAYDQTSLRLKKNGQKDLREIYLIPKEKFPFKNEINIYDDKVAIVSHEDEVGVIIQNQNITDTQRSIFEFGFEYAKLLEKKILSAADLAFLDDDSEFLGEDLGQY